MLQEDNSRLHQSNLQLQQDVEELHHTSTAEEQAYLTTVHGASRVSDKSSRKIG